MNQRLRFTDGMEFDTSGDLRAVHRSDGWYVVGDGLLIPLDTKEECEAMIAKLKRGGDATRD